MIAGMDSNSNDLGAQSDEQKNTHVEIIIIDEKFRIPSHIAKQIPFIDQLSKAIDLLSTEEIIINEVSPKFFKILYDWLKNGEVVDSFKEALVKFEKKSIQKWLRYLCMDKLLEQMYGLETIDGKMVIYGIKDVYFPEAHMHSPACILYNDNLTTYIDIDDAVICVEGSKILIDTISYIHIKCHPGCDHNDKHYILNNNIIEQNNKYYVPLKDVVRYNLIFHNVKHLQWLSK
jgi:SpoU rRNA methylase family enzyme